MRVKVACVQMAPVRYQKQLNVQRMERYIHQVMAMDPETQLIVFPELATTGYECANSFFDLAEAVDGEPAHSISVMRGLCKAYQIHIIYGFAEKASDGSNRIYNAQILIDDAGMIVGTYRKVHLFDTEKQWFTPGDTYQVYDTAIGKLGLFICYDASFPEVTRILALKGADILINSTNWEKPSVVDMEICMTARAFENTTFLICCNRVGTDEALTFFGHSRILDPLGRIIVKQDEEIEAILTAELDFNKMAHVRSHYYTMLRERRPETYGLLCRGD